MDINKIKGNQLVICIISIYFLFTTSCDDCKPIGGCDPSNSFVITDSLHLKNDTINLGDTLWVGSSFTDSLQIDFYPYSRMYFPSCEISIGMLITDIRSKLYVTPEVINVKGIYQDFGLIYEYTNQMYHHKVGLVFKNRGVFLLQLASGFAISPDDCECNDAYIHPRLYVSNNRNLYLLPKSDISMYDTTTIAAFVVK